MFVETICVAINVSVKDFTHMKEAAEIRNNLNSKTRRRKVRKALVVGINNYHHSCLSDYLNNAEGVGRPNELQRIRSSRI